MRYIIYGAGAIGGGIGARLFQAGHEVVLICRGAHLEAIRSGGLRLFAPDGEATLPVPAVSHPREIEFRDGDVVLLTVKSQDTEGALYDLETNGGANVPVVIAQNGVDNERRAARRFKDVYAMLVTMPATYLVPGEIIASGEPITAVLHAGRFPSGVDETITRVCADISGSRMLAEPDPAVMRLKYAKLLSNLGNAFQTITDHNVTRGAGNDEARAFMRAVREEAVACYQAAGIDWASDEEYTERVQKYVRIGDVPGKPRGGNSTWQSVMRGATVVEVDALNGEIALLGTMHGVATPYNRVLRRVAQAMAAAGEKPGRYSVADLQAMVEAEREAAAARV